MGTIHSTQTAENQIRALREHAECAGRTIIGEFVDTVVSGTRERRPGLDTLMADARRRGRFVVSARRSCARRASSVSRPTHAVAYRLDANR